MTQVLSFLQLGQISDVCKSQPVRKIGDNMSETFMGRLKRTYTGHGRMLIHFSKIV
jgi:hypothetical protein